MAASRASAIAAAVSKRALASGERLRMTMASTLSGVVGDRSRGPWGAPWRTLPKVATSSPAWKRRDPVKSSQSTTPVAYTSTRRSMGWFLSCSGAM